MARWTQNPEFQKHADVCVARICKKCKMWKKPNVPAQNSFKKWSVLQCMCQSLQCIYTYPGFENIAVTIANQGSVKPCFTLSPNSNKKCSLGEKMPCPSYVGVQEMHPLETLAKCKKWQWMLNKWAHKKPWSEIQRICMAPKCQLRYASLLWPEPFMIQENAVVHAHNVHNQRCTSAQGYQIQGQRYLKRACAQMSLLQKSCAPKNFCQTASNPESLQTGMENCETSNTCTQHMSMLLHMRNWNEFLCSSHDVTKKDRQTDTVWKWIFVLCFLTYEKCDETKTKCDKIPNLIWRSWCDEVTSPRRWSGWKALPWTSSRPRSSPSSCSTSSSCNHGT